MSERPGRLPHPTAGPDGMVDSLSAQGITVQFGGLRALEDIDIDLRRGAILGLIGPNGAGKTTLVNVLTGFQRATAGHITVDGRIATGWSPRKFARAGVVRSFQTVRLFHQLTVIENVSAAAIGVGASSAAARARATELLAWVGCIEQAERPANALSYSDERRVGVARALATLPRFLLLDEPAAGMNEAECEELIGLITRIPERFGCGVLVIEHNMAVIMQACARIHVLDGGRSIASGTPDGIRADANVQRAYLGHESDRHTELI